MRTRFKKNRPAALLSILIMAFGILATNFEQAGAQISIAPTAVFMSDRSPFANVIVSNGSQTAQEITIGFRFGYSISDGNGNVSMHYDTSGNEYSFVNHVNAFPRNFVLEPGQRQTVRLAARGYGDKGDATYWSRVNILATPLSQPVEAETGNESVAARININFEQVIPAFFKKGDVSTGLDIDEISFERDGNQGLFLINAKRSGNSPFIGSSRVIIRNSEGTVIKEQDLTFSVYFDITRSINLDLSELSRGNYTADFIFQTERRDISRSDLIHAEPISKSLEFTIE